MKPFYWQGTRNFGDYLNSWIWPRLLPGCLSDDASVRLVGVGSLLKASLNLLEGRKVIFGSGSGYGSIPKPEHYRDWEFYFVRGPLTAECFRLPHEKSIVDGAWLIGLLPEFEEFRSKRHGVTFIPHWATSETGDWEIPCSMAGFEYLDPQGDLEGILQRIASSELVVTESLHGAIVADLFRTPWIPVRISPKFLSFKWLDWFRSIELEGQMRSLPLSDMFEFIYHRRSFRFIDYTGRAVPVPECTLAEEVHELPPPGKLYRVYSSTKGRLRSLRRKALDACKRIRGVYPLSSWNERHQCKLAKTFERIAQLEPLMSTDLLHAKKMEQLFHVTEKLKRDFSD